MHGHDDLHRGQLADFVTSGYLMLRGEFTLPMIEDLLDALADPAKILGALRRESHPEGRPPT